jgi:N utilization substance protein B
MTRGRRQRHERASASRLAAVQALYQLDLDSVGLEQALDTAKARGAALDEVGLSAEIDPQRMEAIVRGVAGDRGGRLDGMIDGSLSGGWKAERLEILMRVILRAGIYELLECPDVPAKAIINEYVEVAHAFFDRGEPGMVNAVLDRLARILRTAEFDAAAPA